MSSDRSMSRRASGSSLASRLARVGSAAALALMAVTCHSDNTGNPCTVSSLAFTTQPGTVTAGSNIAATVTVRDGSGNALTCFNDNVTIALGANPGGTTLGGTATVAAASGVATFNSLNITKAANGYTLVASVGNTSTTSSSFNVTANSPTALAFTTQPATVAAGAPISVTVTARDAYGNTATGFASSVTVAIGTNPGSATLGGTTAVTATAGVAIFNNLTITKVGTGYTLTAAPTAGAPPSGATSAAFNVNPGPTTQLAFTAQPTNTTGGAPISPVVVTAQDAQGNTTPAFTGNITVAIGNNAGSGTLSGTSTVAAVNGVATFNGLSINKPGTGYTLAATAGSLPAATSAAFDVAIGPVAGLVFTQEPSDAAAGVAIAPAVVVTAQDLGGNTVTSFTDNVTVAIGTNPGSGTLSGNLTKPAVAGVVTYNSLSIDKSGTGYTLTATAGGNVPQASSNTFNITPAAAAKLSFSLLGAQQPTTTSAGAAITPAVKVTALDQFDNLDTSFAANVTVAIGTNPSSGTLSGTATIAAAHGVATFSTLSINHSGVGYTLTATASGLTDATSSTFDITPGLATQLVFSQQPTSATAGAGIAPAVAVTALDAQGNVATGYTANVTVAIGTNAGGGTLSGTATVAASAGVATFAGLSINKSGTGYTLKATSGTLTDATSTPFNIVAGAATQLVITTQPVNTAAGAAIAPAIVVAAQDGLGNTDLTYTANVVVAIGTNPGTGVLSGTATRAAANGVATFDDLNINQVGAGYTLGFTSGTLTGATSSAFDIFANNATHLVFSVQPSNAVAGVAIAPAVVVQALDGSNNLATGFTGGVTIAIGTNAGGGTLSGTASLSAVGGIATFSGLSIDKTGDGYTLTATTGGLPVLTSGSFKITPAAATHLIFSQQPVNTTAGATIAVTVQARDAFDNVDTAYTANVDMTVGNNPGSGTLSGTTPKPATHGVATFSDLSINKSGTGYTLHATSGSLTDATSNAFDITPDGLSQLVFTQQPTNTTAGATINSVVVAAEDGFGNVVTSFNGNVGIAIGTNAGGGTLSGTTPVAAINGVATFSNLSINKSGSGYTLVASTSGTPDAASASFDVTAGAATVLAFTVQPATSTLAGSAISPPITVAAQDGLGNTVSSFGGDIAIAITNGTGTPNANLSGTKTVTATSGIATFSNLSIDSAGAGYTLTASTGVAGVASGTSNPFAITPGTATKLAFAVNPVTTTAGQPIPTVTVKAQDALGNTDTTYSASIGVAITGGTGKANASLSGTASVAATKGVASYANLAIDSAGANYTLTASSGSLTSAVSAAFNITPGSATTLVFSVQPTTAQAGAVISPNVTLVAKDAIGNIDTSYAKAVTLSLAVNPRGASLSQPSVTASHGVATFTALSLDSAGTGYRLQATDGTLTSAQSNAFDITPGAADHLFFAQQPTNTLTNDNINPAVVVVAQDIFNNTVTTFNNNITIAKASGTGAIGGQLTKAAINGVATFSTLDFNAAGAYTISAASVGLPTITSNSFTVSDPVATQLFFTGQPATSTTAGASLGTMTVQVRDAAGNIVTSPPVSVSLAIKAGTGTDGAALGGTIPVTTVNGVATFSDITIDKAGNGYKLVASATSLTSAESKFFAITAGTVSQLVFRVQPSDAAAGQAIQPAIEVAAVDALGNINTSFTSNVTMAINTNPGSGTLSGTLTVPAVSGIASFTNLSINNQGTSYDLKASAGAFNVTSSPFNITAAVGNHLVFSTPPANTKAGDPISGGMAVEVLDGSNLVATTFVGNVTLSIKANTGPAGATLRGTVTRPVVNGVANFDDVNIDKAGNLYKLVATTSGAAGTTSAFFNITPGTATQVLFTADPVTTTAGATIPTVVVTAKDSLGNTDTNFTGAVRVQISTNPGSGTLSGDTIVNAAAGVASFTTLSINKSGSGYRLTASSGTLTPDVSNGFSINAGAATHLVFTVSPSNTVHNQPITPAIRVAAYDAFDNVATSFGSDITLAIATGTQGASITGTTTITPTLGEAIFSGLSINLVGTYTLSATTTGLSPITSVSFVIN